MSIHLHMYHMQVNIHVHAYDTHTPSITEALMLHISHVDGETPTGGGQKKCNNMLRPPGCQQASLW